MSRDDLTLAEVCEALQTREKMKGMVQTDASSSKGDALQVRGRPEQKPTTSAVTRARTAETVQSSEARINSIGIVRKIITSLMIVGSCRIRRKETVHINRKINPMVMARPLLSTVLIVLMVNA